MEESSTIKTQQNLVQLIRYIIQKKVFLIVFSLIGCVLGITYSLIKKPVYIASTTFSLQEESKMSGGGLLSLASSFGLDMGGAGGLFSGDNIEQVFKSRKIVEQVIYQQNPTSSLTFGDEYLEINGIKKQLNISSAIFTVSFKDLRLKDSLCSVIHKLLNAGYMEILRPDKKYDIYEVSMKSTNEAFSKNFVKELINQVSLFYTETKTRKAKLNVDVLQNRVDSIHNALGGTLYQRAESSIMSLNPAFQTGKVPEQFKNIDVTALGTGYGELLKNLELAKYTLLKETPLFQIIDEAKLPLKKKTYSPFFYALLSSFIFLLLSLGILIFIKLLSNVKQLIADTN